MSERYKVKCLDCRRTRVSDFASKMNLFYIGVILFFLMLAIKPLIILFIIYFVWALLKPRKLCCSICNSTKIVPLDRWEAAEQNS